MMNGDEFISFAGKLAAQTSNGAPAFRSAVSRAYYGAFHLARHFIQKNFNWFCHSDNEHLWVQRHFLNCVSPDVRLIGVFLVDLHTSRKKADYDLDYSVADRQDNAMACVVRAGDIKAVLLRLSEDSMLDQVRQEMEAYRSRVNLG